MTSTELAANVEEYFEYLVGRRRARRPGHSICATSDYFCRG